MKYMVCIVLALASFAAAEEPKKVDKRGVLGLGYGGLGYSGLGYSGLGYSGLGYGYGSPLLSAGLPLAYSKTIAPAIHAPIAPIAAPIHAPLAHAAVAAPLAAPLAHAAIAAPALHSPLAYGLHGAYGYGGLGYGLGYNGVW